MMQLNDIGGGYMDSFYQKVTIDTRLLVSLFVAVKVGKCDPVRDYPEESPIPVN